MKMVWMYAGMKVASANLLPGERPPVVHTYRNAYGTHFDVSSTWMLLLGMYVVFVVGGLLLLSVIPVRFATNEKLEAPFVLWFGSAKKKKKKVKRVEKKQQDEPVETESLLWRASTWMVQTIRRFFASAPSRDADVRYRFHADMTQQLAASVATAKTYESIKIPVAETTDDFETKSPPPQENLSGAVTAVVEFKTPASTGDLRTSTRPASRSSIFVSTPPSPPSAGRMQQRSTRLGSDASSVKAESIGRRSRATSGASMVETKEDFVRAASRRQSMAVRTERRVALAREDVSYENLEDDEMQVYEYLEFVRELLDGLALKKLCQKSGRVVSRKLYITADMQVVFWNSIGAIKRQTRKSSLRTELIESVERGVHGSDKVVARSTPEREALCVSIRCSDGKMLVLEAKTEAMRQRLFLGFSRLAQEKHEEEKAAATIPEEREEEFDDRDEHKTLAETQMKMMPTIAEGSLERALAVTEAHESELEYEEKAVAPVLEETVLRHELLSVRSSYGQADDIDEVLHAVSTPLDEDDISLLQREEGHQEEQREEEKSEERVVDDDIENLSDDPELSRE
ncbi:hypothetical protein L914_05612 [Phytophthora nicotianae]|uniref:Uncharacterized protein n=1 Tax=Phytophthora nicotianae TaxID=4792 RepID=W2NRM9_PHYNI|nr:hypothetical protein L914_05612 [Phytophthora nicotianae]